MHLLSEDPRVGDVGPQLFHGPKAREAALRFLHAHDLDLRFDGELTAQSAREIVELRQEGSLALSPWAYLIGPVDEASIAGVDGLLKFLEEMGPEDIDVPVLWAGDEGEVLPTLLSRCRVQWCPGETEVSYETLLFEEGWAGEEWSKGNPREVAEAVAQSLRASSWDLEKAKTWDLLRRALRRKTPSLFDLDVLLERVAR